MHAVASARHGWATGWRLLKLLVVIVAVVATSCTSTTRAVHAADPDDSASPRPTQLLDSTSSDGPAATFMVGVGEPPASVKVKVVLVPPSQVKARQAIEDADRAAIAEADTGAEDVPRLVAAHALGAAHTLAATFVFESGADPLERFGPLEGMMQTGMCSWLRTDKYIGPAMVAQARVLDSRIDQTTGEPLESSGSLVASTELRADGGAAATSLSMDSELAAATERAVAESVGPAVDRQMWWSFRDDGKNNMQGIGPSVSGLPTQPTGLIVLGWFGRPVLEAVREAAAATTAAAAKADDPAFRRELSWTEAELRGVAERARAYLVRSGCIASVQPMEPVPLHARARVLSRGVVPLPPRGSTTLAASPLGPFSLYMDLVKRVVVNTVYRDNSVIGSGERQRHDRRMREHGLDWPLQALTMVGLHRLDNLQFCLEEVLFGSSRSGVDADGSPELGDPVPGDLIETGVWRGGATVMMAAALAAAGDTSRRVFAADSFEGLPPPRADLYPVDENDDHHGFDHLRVSQAVVRESFVRLGLLPADQHGSDSSSNSSSNSSTASNVGGEGDGASRYAAHGSDSLPAAAAAASDRVVFLEGFFNETLPRADMSRLAILRMDGDMYESTMDALMNLYGRVSTGGYVIVDDFCVKGARLASLDFRRDAGIYDTLHAIDSCGVYWRKTGPYVDPSVLRSAETAVGGGMVQP